MVDLSSADTNFYKIYKRSKNNKTMGCPSTLISFVESFADYQLVLKYPRQRSNKGQEKITRMIPNSTFQTVSGEVLRRVINNEDGSHKLHLQNLENFLMKYDIQNISLVGKLQDRKSVTYIIMDKKFANSTEMISKQLRDVLGNIDGLDQTLFGPSSFASQTVERDWADAKTLDSLLECFFPLDLGLSVSIYDITKIHSDIIYRTLTNKMDATRRIRDANKMAVMKYEGEPWMPKIFKLASKESCNEGKLPDAKTKDYENGKHTTTTTTIDECTILDMKASNEYSRELDEDEKKQTQEKREETKREVDSDTTEENTEDQQNEHKINQNENEVNLQSSRCDKKEVESKEVDEEEVLRKLKELRKKLKVQSFGIILTKCQKLGGPTQKKLIKLMNLEESLQSLNQILNEIPN